MDIGTAKPDKAERDLAPHHLIDFLEPDEDFDAQRYMEAADAAINDIFARSKLPIIAGGTGFYIKALLHGLFRDRNADPDVLSRLEKEKGENGSQALHDRLRLLDPESAARIHPNDGFRIVRALEVVEVTGQPISTFQKQHGFASQRYAPIKIALCMDRAELYRRIDNRVDIMIEQGFVEEVRTLVNMGFTCELKSMQSIGYRHICDFLHGRVLSNGIPFVSDDTDILWKETVRLLKRDTRRYAKRQLTWFRQDQEMVWLPPDATDQAQALITKFLNSPL